MQHTLILKFFYFFYLFLANPRGASVPSLGLSNKAVYETDEPAAPKHVKDEYPENYFVPITLTGWYYLRSIFGIFVCNFLKTYCSTTTRGHINAKHIMARSTKTVWSWI